MPGVEKHVPVGLLHITAASAKKKLFVYAIHKADLSLTMEWGSMTFRENYAYVFDTQAGILDMERMPVFLIIWLLQ